MISQEMQALEREGERFDQRNHRTYLELAIGCARTGATPTEVLRLLVMLWGTAHARRSDQLAALNDVGEWIESRLAREPGLTADRLILELGWLRRIAVARSSESRHEDRGFPERTFGLRIRPVPAGQSGSSAGQSASRSAGGRPKWDRPAGSRVPEGRQGGKRPAGSHSDRPADQDRRLRIESDQATPARDLLGRSLPAETRDRSIGALAPPRVPPSSRGAGVGRTVGVVIRGIASDGRIRFETAEEYGGSRYTGTSVNTLWGAKVGMSCKLRVASIDERKLQMEGRISLA